MASIDLTALSPYMDERDWNWYLSADNVPNQDAVFATRDFLRTHRAAEIDALDFFNLLWKQKELLPQYLGKPVDYVERLSRIKLPPNLRHTLFGMMLYWHGGEASSMFEGVTEARSFKTILRLIEEEFWMQFPDQATPEKDFCINEPGRRQIKEGEARLKIENPKRYPQSHYLYYVPFDFEELPGYVVKDAIIRKWEKEWFRKTEDYDSWLNNLGKYLNSIPEQYRFLALRKGIEYGKRCYEWHLLRECETPNDCVYNESWERRFTIAMEVLRKSEQKSEEDAENEDKDKQSGNREFTLARQLLAIHYLLKYAKAPTADRAVTARFVQFLTGREGGASEIKNTTIYKRLGNLLSTDEKTAKADLQFVQRQFQDLGLNAISKMIENELSKGRS